MDDESIPLSQLANEAFNPTAPHDLSLDASVAAPALPGAPVGPTDFRGLAASLVNGQGGNGGGAVDDAGPGPGSGRTAAAAAAGRLSKSGKLFQVGGRAGGRVAGSVATAGRRCAWLAAGAAGWSCTLRPMHGALAALLTARPPDVRATSPGRTPSTASSGWTPPAPSSSTRGARRRQAGRARAPALLTSAVPPARGGGLPGPPTPSPRGRGGRGKL